MRMCGRAICRRESSCCRVVCVRDPDLRAVGDEWRTTTIDRRRVVASCHRIGGRTYDDTVRRELSERTCLVRVAQARWGRRGQRDCAGTGVRVTLSLVGFGAVFCITLRRRRQPSWPCCGRSPSSLCVRVAGVVGVGGSALAHVERVDARVVVARCGVGRMPEMSWGYGDVDDGRSDDGALRTVGLGAVLS